MAMAQVGATGVQLNNMGLFKSQGLIDGEWRDALDGRTLAVCCNLFFPSSSSDCKSGLLFSSVVIHFSVWNSFCCWGLRGLPYFCRLIIPPLAN